MPQRDEAPTFMIEDAKIRWRNFSGKEGQYNPPGVRSFVVELDEEAAKKMLEDGWNVKWPKPGEDDEVGAPFISVAVKYENYPPRIVMLTSKARRNLTEDMVEVLDWANIDKVDLICRGHVWDVNGKGGIKAYVKSMFVTIEEDYLERKYGVNEPEE